MGRSQGGKWGGVKGVSGEESRGLVGRSQGGKWGGVKGVSGGSQGG